MAIGKRQCLCCTDVDDTHCLFLCCLDGHAKTVPVPVLDGCCVRSMRMSHQCLCWINVHNTNVRDTAVFVLDRCKVHNSAGPMSTLATYGVYPRSMHIHNSAYARSMHITQQCLPQINAHDTSPRT
eukprot:2121757-Rhodomonas_salina.1